MIEVTVDEFPADESLVLDPVIGLFVPETLPESPPMDVASTPWCSTPVHQFDIPPIPPPPPVTDLVSPVIPNQALTEMHSVPEEGANVTLATTSTVSVPATSSKIRMVLAPIIYLHIPGKNC